MDSILSVSPGLIIWTLVNFFIFFFLLFKLGFKQIAKGLKTREDSIRESIEGAERANLEAKRILEESQAKLSTAQQEMTEIITKGRTQAEEIVRKAAEDAEKVKQSKVEEAKKEIERSKDNAIKELRKEVADLVIEATEKIIGENIDKEKNYKMIESYIGKIPNN
jgi:F-type H+-transporting ATPase subunit b